MSVLARRIAHILAGHAAQRLPSQRAAWGDPMRAEVDAIENDLAALQWAAGCLLATYGERITPMKTMSFAPLAGAAGLIAFVFGVYAISGGPLQIIAEAMPPLSLTIVLGALAVTSILSSNGGPGLFTSLGRAFRGRRYHVADYEGLAATLGSVLSSKEAVTRTDAVSRIIADAKLLTYRHPADNTPVDAAQVGALLQDRIDAIVTLERRGVRVLELLARSILWLSAIAFVLAVTKIMIYVTDAPEVLGGMLAHALVAPLLGVFLGAGIVHPLAQRLAAGIADDANIYTVIRAAFLARLAGVEPAAAVRMACGGLPIDLMPTPYMI
jgi:flagellar motor component MotA